MHRSFRDTRHYLKDLDEGWGRKTIRQQLSPTEQMIVDLLGTAKSFGLDLSGISRSSSALDRIANRVEAMIAPLTQYDDPKGTYAHCLCDFD